MGALSGIKVLDLSIIVQGPQAAAMLADLGAEVIKVELPGAGDLARWITISPDDQRSAYFYALNRGKRSVTLDLRTPGGKRAVLRLAETADVVVSNFSPGTLERWGLGYEELSAVNPRIVFATGSAFGPVGPDAEREGADLVGQAVGGIISTTGVDGGDPTPIAAVIADHCGSQNMVIGILAALLHREQTGRGQRVDVSLLGGQIWAQASEITHYLLSGQLPGRANRGNPMVRALYGIFRTADGWLALVGVPNHLWTDFCRAIEREDLVDDARFNTLFQRPEDLAVRWGICDEVFPHRTTDDWCARLKAHGQRYAPVNDYIRVVDDPQPWANGYLVRVEHPEWGEIPAIGCPILFSETPAVPGAVAPELGAHTEEILLAAGFGWDELEQLRAEGAW
jgi:CoA:oxalate CoA-transferase